VLFWYGILSILSNGIIILLCYSTYLFINLQWSVTLVENFYLLWLYILSKVTICWSSGEYRGLHGNPLSLITQWFVIQVINSTQLMHISTFYRWSFKLKSLKLISRHLTARYDLSFSLQLTAQNPLPKFLPI